MRPLNLEPGKRKTRVRASSRAFKESGCIEQDVDLVCLLYRPEAHAVEAPACGGSSEPLLPMNLWTARTQVDREPHAFDDFEALYAI